MDVSDRIQMVMRMHNMNASAFAETLGVQRSGISHILSGRNKPSLDLVEKIIRKFPRVNAEWLVTGHTPQEEKPIPAEASSKEIAQSTNESVERVIVFFKDGTFETYNPKR